jgi:hypothetical protein
LGTPLPPLEFLPEKERHLVEDGDSIRTSLYKILLFKSVAEAVKAGNLNLKYSYRYRAIQDYLIPAQRWQADRDRLLTLAGLDKFANGTAYLAELKETLDDTYQSVNHQFHEGSIHIFRSMTPAMPVCVRQRRNIARKALSGHC